MPICNSILITNDVSEKIVRVWANGIVLKKTKSSLTTRRMKRKKATAMSEHPAIDSRSKEILYECQRSDKNKEGITDKVKIIANKWIFFLANGSCIFKILFTKRAKTD